MLGNAPHLITVPPSEIFPIITSDGPTVVHTVSYVQRQLHIRDLHCWGYRVRAIDGAKLAHEIKTNTCWAEAEWNFKGICTADYSVPLRTGMR